MNSTKINTLFFIFAFLTLIPSLKAQSICNSSLTTSSIHNGEFGTGNSSFQINDPFLSTQYSFEPTWPSSPGSFAIASSTNNAPQELCWIETTDNSSAFNGYMQIVNGSIAQQVFYNKTVEICDNLSFVFSFDIINLRKASCSLEALPNIAVRFNNETVFTTNSINQNENWQHFEFEYQVPSGFDVLHIQLLNLTATDQGNDFAIDNLAMQHCGPVLNIPVTSSFCPNSGIEIIAEINNLDYPNPFFQWQQSFDGGVSWSNLNNENQSNLFLANPVSGLQYRLAIANSPINYINPNCRITSNSTILQAVTPIEVFLTPTICEGDTIYINNTPITSEGEYTTIIAGQTPCDTIMHSLVFTFPSYDQTLSANLCPGDNFQGQSFQADTTYTLFFNSENGCDSIVTYEIEVNGIGDLAIEGNNILCSGESTTLSANSNFSSYEWNTGSTNSSIEVSTGGWYSLSVTNSYGCNLSTNLEVSLSDLYLVPGIVQNSCPENTDGMIEVIDYGGGLEPYLFSIDGQTWSDTHFFTGLPANTYSLSMQDALGCETEIAVELNNQTPFSIEILGLPSAVTNLGDTLFLMVSPINEQLTYTWSGEGRFSCSTCSSTAWLPLGEGNISLTAVDSFGCSQQITSNILLSDRYGFYIPSAFSPNNDGQNDTLSPLFGMNVDQILLWEIYDRWGGKIFSASPSSPFDSDLEWDGYANGKPAKEGVYLYRVQIQFENGQTKEYAGDINLIR
ncbi:MAG: gliding motility-associated C-terminal domain-containing protein [Crocinitomicaceae bacterium]|nr:gliding motility-associated C-terminal domain-containing protein [Crocinitomicaceae bacterium]